jgi:superfamily II DNA/RNA helicase
VWSPERDSNRGRRDGGGHFSRGGRRDGSFDSRSNRGGGNRGGRGRRFTAPDLDIERFIEKSKREIEDQKANASLTPVHVVTNDFASLITHPKLREMVVKKGYTKPTPIQDKAIPHVYQKKDVVGIANTGTGKTAAFLLPLIDRALVHEHERTLIVVPTRELATQIWEEFQGFARGLGLSAAVVIGGANIRPQISAVRSARFVVGTPGRLKDLIERRALDMKSFTAIVLDEADRMLDMGFIPDIRFLMERMSHERHSLCFSATMPPEIERLINEFLKSPISVSTKTSATSHAVEQSVVRITEGSSKMGLLEELLRDPALDKVIVFGATKRGVERLAKQLSMRGIRAESIHGNKSSNQRKRALDAFKSGRTRVLVATDVAARGLDISDVSHVINFDVPHTYEDYVHRIGRTGRAGKVGKAMTFVEGA